MNQLVKRIISTGLTRRCSGQHFCDTNADVRSVCGSHISWLCAGYVAEAEVGCQELTSKRYISDGFCTSVRPVTERVCVGYCLPVDVLPRYAQHARAWARSSLNYWRCVEQRRRSRRHVTLRCDNGQVRRYAMRVVTGCRCQRVRHGLHDHGPVSLSVTALSRGREQRLHRYQHQRRRRRPLSSTDSVELN